MSGGGHLLSLREFSVAYRGDAGEVVALDNINFGIPVGARLAIIGESGSGKSTLALAIAGLLPDSAVAGGSIEWSGSPPLPGRDIGFVFQNPTASLDPVMSVGRQVAEVARAHLKLDREAAYERALALFERVRLPDPAAMRRAFPHQLSGGQKQRVAIAAAIAAGPKLLIADEATSALDTIVQAEIVALIGELVASTGMTLVFISHDIALAATIADRIAVFRSGRLMEVGPACEVVNNPRHPYTRTLLEAHIGLDTPPLLRSGACHD